VEPTELLSQSAGSVGRLALAYGLVELLQAWGVDPYALTGEGEGWFAAGCAAGVFRPEDAVRLLKVRGAVPLADARVRLFHPVTGEVLIGPAARDSECWEKLPTGGVPHTITSFQTQCDIVLSLDTLPSTEILSGLYLSGVNLKWSEVFRGSGCRRVGLPTYPFQRKRYWIANARSFHLPPDLAARAETKCVLGSPGERFSTLEAANRLGVVERHRRLLGRLLEILAEEGDVTRDERGWAMRAIPRGEDPEELLAEVTTRYPACGAEIGLLGRCGPRLLDVLRGKLAPLPLLFPPADSARTGAEQVYAESPFAKRMNLLAAEAAAWAAGRPGARVLEVGAGTGGTTTAILPRLTGVAEYRFTDVSAGFFPAASRRFGDYGFVRFGVLDFDSDPDPATFAPGSFDLIVAAHALHAAKRLVPALSRLRKLLAPGGTLLLVEGGSKERGLDLTFGLTAGWWGFEDTDLRPDYPLVSHDRWPRILRDAGFADTAVLPEGNLIVACADSRAELGFLMSTLRERATVSASELAIDQYASLKTDLERLSLAYIRRALFTPPEEVPSPASTNWVYDVAWRELMLSVPAPQSSVGDWLILANRGGLGDQLAAKLEALGGRARLVFPPEAGEPFPRLDAKSCRGVVVLWALDAGTEPAMLGETLVELFRAESQGPIYVVTRGAVPVLSGVVECEAAQSAIWGIGRVAALEHPERWGGLIDLDPADPEPATTLAVELLREGGESQTAIRGGRRFVPRLVRVPRPPRTQLRCRPDATYLITGGLGTLGRAIAKRLVGRGARNVVLQSRSGADSPARAEFLRELQNRGVRVRAATVDVADRAAMSRLLTEVRSESSLAGVVHAAGVTAPQTRRCPRTR
jgi:SAM-dependent methyltransferase